MFISFEGIDCSGKSTQVKLLAKALRSKDYEVLITREPGGTKSGEKMRDILKNYKLTKLSEILLLYASRNQHVHEVILPALKQGKIVISDRFNDSTIAYQHYGRGYDLSQIEELTKLTIGDFKPDLSILMDIGIEIRNERMKKRNLDIIEREEQVFHEKVIQGYRKIVKDNPRFIVLDGSKKPFEIAKIIFKEVFNKLSSLKENK